MDHERFDDLTRVLAKGLSRRQILRGIVGSAAGGVLALLGRGVAAQECPSACAPNASCAGGACACNAG